jgi:hypothetical protein
MKRAIGALRVVPHYAMELFVEGEEEPLDDAKWLMLVEKVLMFMLPKAVSDRQALEALFRSCGGAGWNRKEGWATDADLGEWQGRVTVDAAGRVMMLELYSSNLAGPLPCELQQLSALQELILGDNQLAGPIPAVLGQLEALAVLDLSWNQLSGPIPAEWGQLGVLTYLNLGYKNLIHHAPVMYLSSPIISGVGCVCKPGLQPAARACHYRAVAARDADGALAAGQPGGTPPSPAIAQPGELH